MFYLKDYEGDALALTDEQVAADWRMGLLRGVARVMREQALPLDSADRSNVAVPGSNRAHLQPGPRQRPAECHITELYEVEEESEREFVYASMGGQDYDVIKLSGKATCACGKLQKYPVEMSLNPAELISRVTNA